MSKLLSVVATKILHDTYLRQTITNGVQSIMKDGKIDSSDIPEIMLIIMECTQNLGKFNLTYNQLVEVLEEVILYILEEQNVIPEDKKEDIYKVIRSSIKLVLLQPKLKSCLSGVWTKLKKLICCGKSDEQVSQVVNKVKHTVETVVEQVAEHIPKPVVEPVVENIAEPVVENIAEPVVENIAEPVAENIAEPVAENIAEIAEPVTEEVVAEEKINQ